VSEKRKKELALSPSLARSLVLSSALSFSLSLLLSLFSFNLTCITDATAMGAITYSSAVAEHCALEGIEEPEGEEPEGEFESPRSSEPLAVSPEQSAETSTSGRFAMLPKAAAAATTLRRLSLSCFRSREEERERADFGKTSLEVSVPTTVPAEIATPMLSSRNHSFRAAFSAPARRTKDRAGMKTW